MPSGVGEPLGARRVSRQPVRKASVVVVVLVMLLLLDGAPFLSDQPVVVAVVGQGICMARLLVPASVVRRNGRIVWRWFGKQIRLVERFCLCYAVRVGQREYEK